MGNYSTPEGEVENSQSRTATTSLGGAWTGEHSYVGASYGYTDMKYGIPDRRGRADQPDAAAPRVQRPRRRVGSSTGCCSRIAPPSASARYEHQELEGDEVGTTFDNDTVEGELLLSHRKTAATGRQRRRMVPQPPVRRRPAKRRCRRRWIRTARPRSSTRRWPGRTPRCSSAAASITRATRPRAGCPARDFTECVGLGRAAHPARGGERQLRDCRQRRARPRVRPRSRSSISSVRTSATSRSRSATPIWSPSGRWASTSRCAPAATASKAR